MVCHSNPLKYFDDNDKFHAKFYNIQPQFARKLYCKMSGMLLGDTVYSQSRAATNVNLLTVCSVKLFKKY